MPMPMQQPIQQPELSDQAQRLFSELEAIVAQVRELAPEQEKQTCVDPSIIRQLREGGFFRVLQPKRWGGYEMHPLIFSQLQMRLAEADMSTAWVYGVMGCHNFQMGLFDDQAAQDVWGEDSSAIISSTFQPGGVATPVEGGYRFSGRWKFSSGVDHADWVFLGGLHEQEFLTCLVPKKDYEIVQTWDVFGLKATGSQDVAVKDIFVPKHRVHHAMDGFRCDSPGNAVNTAALYRIPFQQIFIRAITTSALGALRGMLQAFEHYAENRVSSLGNATREDPDAQAICAEILAELDEMELVLIRNYNELLEHAQSGEPPPMDRRLLFKYQAAAVPDRCLRLAKRLFQCVGGSGIFATQPFGRYYRDIITSRQHAAAQSNVVARSWGGIVLGKENQEWYL